MNAESKRVAAVIVAAGSMTRGRPSASAPRGSTSTGGVGPSPCHCQKPSSSSRLAADTAHPASPTFAGDGIRRDGHAFPLELSLAVWHADDQACLTAVVRDVTARQASEALLRERDRQLREAQKMDAIGQIGRAHV